VLKILIDCQIGGLGPWKNFSYFQTARGAEGENGGHTTHTTTHHTHDEDMHTRQHEHFSMQQRWLWLVCRTTTGRLLLVAEK
jgi:ABC-type Zn2+ transport system substrate-binding protein/surface adhesin